MTVSRVLRNRGDVSAATREKVLSAARMLGYVPNRIAGSLASQRVNLVAVVIPSLANLVFPDVLAGISAALEGTGLQPVVGVTQYDPDREEAVLYDMLSWRPSGVILAGIEHSEASSRMLSSAGIPVVEVMDVDGVGIDCVVGISHRRAGAEMAARVLAAGYRRIGLLGAHIPGDHRARKRLEGFEAVLAQQGLTVAAREFYQGGSSLAKGRDLARRILEHAPDIDFLYCSNDMIGAGALLWCMEQGMGVPDRLGLAGFNAVEQLQGLPMRLATTDARRHEIGRHAARILAGKDPRPPGGVLELVPTTVPGDTIRPAMTP